MNFPPRFGRYIIIFREIADRAIEKLADAIAIRIIRGDGQVIRADSFHECWRELFARLATRPAQPFEAVAGLPFSSFRLAMAFVFPMLVIRSSRNGGK